MLTRGTIDELLADIDRDDLIRTSFESAVRRLEAMVKVEFGQDAGITFTDAGVDLTGVDSDAVVSPELAELFRMTNTCLDAMDNSKPAG